jgi:hypothetical protein
VLKISSKTSNVPVTNTFVKCEEWLQMKEPIQVPLCMQIVKFNMAAKHYTMASHNFVWLLRQSYNDQRQYVHLIRTGPDCAKRIVLTSGEWDWANKITTCDVICCFLWLLQHFTFCYIFMYIFWGGRKFLRYCTVDEGILVNSELGEDGILTFTWALEHNSLDGCMEACRFGNKNCKEPKAQNLCPLYCFRDIFGYRCNEEELWLCLYVS